MMEERARQSVLADANKLGVLMRQLRVRILNCSASGCLVETNAHLDIGTIGSLRLAIDGEEFTDDLMVVRCQAIEGAGSIFHVGAKFLWTDSPGRTALRCAMRPAHVVARRTAAEAKPLM
jgi:hypothetical protein